MEKGLFSIPLYSQNTPLDQITDEITQQVVDSEKWGVNEAFFGEHISDKYEKITSSLLMAATVSKLTKKIKLGTLTTNLNFNNPAVSASLIAMVDNLSKGRLMLGIGSGANNSDREAVGLLNTQGHDLTLESLEIIKKILYSKTFNKYKTKNYYVSVNKSKNSKLGLGYFNKLYKDRSNLEIVMPALGKNSFNVKLCAKNNWSIVISNFCSEDVVENHIENYLKYSKLNKNAALKKIKLSRYIFICENKNIENLLFNKNSPYYKSVKIIFNKLKTFNKHQCFGNNVETVIDAMKNIMIFGDIKKVKDHISKKIIKKYGKLSSLIYVAIPNDKKIYNDSLKHFAKKI